MHSRVISEVLQLARVHLHRWSRPFHSTYAYSPLTLASWGWPEVSIYTQEIGKCHVSGLLKIQYFLRAGLPPDSHCKHQCAHSFLEKLYQVSSDRGKSLVGPERVYFPEWFWIYLLEIGLEFQPFIQLGNRFCVLSWRDAHIRECGPEIEGEHRCGSKPTMWFVDSCRRVEKRERSNQGKSIVVWSELARF